MFRIYIVFNFRLIESWLRSQSECTNTFHSKTQFTGKNQLFFIQFLLEIISMMQFLIAAKLVSVDWFLFLMLLTILLRKTNQNLVNK